MTTAPQRILCRDAEQAYRCACDAVAINGEVLPVRDQSGRIVAYQATRPAPELLPTDKRHWTPPGICEWEYYW
jgi:hypothetical protein